MGWEVALVLPLWKMVCDPHSTHLPSPFPGGWWPCLSQRKRFHLLSGQLPKCPEDACGGASSTSLGALVGPLGGSRPGVSPGSEIPQFQVHQPCTNRGCLSK